MQMHCDRRLQSLLLKRGGEIISSEHKKSRKVSFLSLSNFPSAVQEEKKSLQDTETRKEPANGQSGGKTGRADPWGA